MAPALHTGLQKVMMPPPPASLNLNIYERLLWRSVYDPSTENTVPGVRTGCVIWGGTIDHGGYGDISVHNKMRSTHRIAYELFRGPIPDELVLDHLCRNRACFNPDHLEPVTLAENNLRGEGCMAIYARKTQCPHGHPYDEKNTQMKNGARRCRTCVSRENRLYREKRKAAALERQRQSELQPA
jgi:hypothetical protein